MGNGEDSLIITSTSGNFLTQFLGLLYPPCSDIPPVCGRVNREDAIRLMTKEQVVSKVRKLFELSNSSNENEAALAAAKARELLSRYNLSMADLPTDDMKAAVAVTEASVGVGRVVRNWVKGLLIHVAYGFDCEHIIRRRHASNPILTFIGTTADAEIAVYTFRFLFGELNRLVDRSLPKLKRENRFWSTPSLRYAYLDGAVKRIGERFQRQTEKIRDSGTPRMQRPDLGQGTNDQKLHGRDLSPHQDGTRQEKGDQCGSF